MFYPKAFTMLFGLLVLPFSATYSYSQPSPLTITILNVQKNKGKLVVEIYNNQTSWLKSPFQKRVLTTNEANAVASFDVPAGRYAVSIYQDVNNNGELDRTFVGIPKEPVGFGNNYKPFGKPKFEAAALDYTPSSKPQEIKLFEVF